MFFEYKKNKSFYHTKQLVFSHQIPCVCASEKLSQFKYFFGSISTKTKIVLHACRELKQNISSKNINRMNVIFIYAR